MAKKLVKQIKLQIPAGKANPAPPIGPALGAAQVNIMAFCKEFNARTQSLAGDILPVVISVYSDKTFEFITKQPPVSRLLLKAIGVETGSGIPNRNKVGKITTTQIREIVKKKAPDLRINSEEAGIQLVKGTARSMGIDVIDDKAAGG